MPPFERVVYEPGEDVRVFDGSEEDEDVEGSRLPLLIVLALLVLAMFAGVVWLAYTQGVARGRTETPVLTAANGPARVAPASAAGGTEQPYKAFKIYEQPAPPDDDTAAPAKPAANCRRLRRRPNSSAAPEDAAPAAPKIPPPPPTKPAIIAAAPKPPVAVPVVKPAPAAAPIGRRTRRKRSR